MSTKGDLTSGTRLHMKDEMFVGTIMKMQVNDHRLSGLIVGSAASEP